ncbi:Flp pilus assembly protein TadG [Nocardioides ginsengisegetis]|uniref:Flp pilus assembly protein TadG n=1 Tax=Nocardioides ginsengisegetis TaxID=661491 RepID=A0A7W3IZ02_9ACTN|nr:TadE/TadG family type IV pilus assembly protein [Nocardioides ginsengisegetis]MBA8803193.1 Flp pilus assembly protein TadG [Nocardioides ginsengisegetis]
MGTMQRRRHAERGAAAVEFGLVALLLVTLLFGIIQFGFWFWAWQSAGHAAREASRIAAVTPCDTAKITTTGTNDLNGTPKNTTPTVTVTKGSPVKVGDTITVRVQFTTLNLGFFPGYTGNIDKSSTSRVENVPAGGC